jgi:hypothetical protein
MKIQKLPTFFKPITITFETTEELDSFYTGIYDLLTEHSRSAMVTNSFNTKRNMFLSDLINKVREINHETT